MGCEENVRRIGSDGVLDFLHEISFKIAHPQHTSSVFETVTDDWRDVIGATAVFRLLQGIFEMLVIQNWPVDIDTRLTTRLVGLVHPSALTSALQVERLAGVIAKALVTREVLSLFALRSLVLDDIEVHNAEAVVVTHQARYVVLIGMGGDKTANPLSGSLLSDLIEDLVLAITSLNYRAVI